MNRLIAAGTCVLVTGVLSAASPMAGSTQLGDSFHRWLDAPAIGYHVVGADPVARLNQRLADGTAHLEFSGPSGYLKSVIEALDVPLQSQLLVFAKDSFQAPLISPETPRALFYNDQVAVGWMPGGFIELASEDPRRGVMFYTLAQTETAQPRFERREDCLSCHYSRSTTGVPGWLLRSAGHFTVDHRLPLTERWGGWYVTGNTGSIEHQGNTSLSRLFTAQRTSDAFNWPSMAGRLDMTPYLSLYSDVDALMVFEHQVHMANLLTRIGWEARMAEAGSDDAVPLGEAAVEVVDYMLFVDEPPLPGPVKGSTGFATTFAARGPFDSHGRSLRQLDLERRLMRYPCSYMIYSPQFEALPAEAKDAIYRRLWTVLSGREPDEKYARLSRDDSSAIVEILQDTKADLPAYFLPSR
jgi:hypothetical protein